MDSSPARWADVPVGVPSEVDTVVCGHTHMPFARPAAGWWSTRAASAWAYGSAGAHRALLGGSTGAAVHPRRTLFDTETTAQSIVDPNGYPGVVRWVDDSVRGTVSDVEAHVVFAPRDGRRQA
ncbi:hypothetical protein [Amycolatopsis antarctica]|uniref:hypothetical protein n=1 Tax=Amycolatopsis antarctica TaxID=1854586 RepID=UPI001F0AA13E|nr:hypothetical protein [Amycolatopsis antarctica]